MKLQDYRKSINLTAQQVADQLATSLANVCRWENGTVPRPAFMRRIAAWSKNAVTAADFYDEVPTV
jgi:transcriptional regulator with XRE-family HTH domain